MNNTAKPTYRLHELREGSFFKGKGNKRRFQLIRKNIDTCVVKNLLSGSLSLQDSKKEVIKVWQEQ